jgi:hypothetical protein
MSEKARQSKGQGVVDQRRLDGTCSRITAFSSRTGRVMRYSSVACGKTLRRRRPALENGAKCSFTAAQAGSAHPCASLYGPAGGRLKPFVTILSPVSTLPGIRRSAFQQTCMFAGDFSLQPR